MRYKDSNYINRRLAPVLVVCLALCSTSLQIQAGRSDLLDIGKKIARVSGKTVDDVAATALGKRALLVRTKHGDEAFQFIQKNGRGSLIAIEKAGEFAPDIIRLHKKIGKKAFYLAETKRGQTLIMQLGDEVAEPITKLGKKSYPLLEDFGAKAVPLLKKCDDVDVKKLNILKKHNVISQTSEGAAILDICGKYGKKGIDYVYANKKKLLTMAVLTTFITDPEPYINGVKDLGSIAITNVAAPVAQEAAKSIHWNLWIGVIILILGLVTFFAVKRKKQNDVNESKS